MSCPQRVMPHRMVSTLDEGMLLFTGDSNCLCKFFRSSDALLPCGTDCRVFIWKLNVGTGHLHCGVSIATSGESCYSVMVGSGQPGLRRSHHWSGPVSMILGTVIRVAGVSVNWLHCYCAPWCIFPADDSCGL